MDRQVFQTQMDRLANLYGSKIYNLDRVTLIWREVNQLSDQWMIKTIDMFIGELERAPLIPKFREEIAKEREKTWKVQKSEKWELPDNIAQYLCSDCDNKGIVNMDDNGKINPFGANYIFKCHCRYGSQRPEKFPRLLRGGLKSVGGKDKC